MWRCPRCGVGLVSRNLSHACGDHTVDAFLARATPHARALYEGFVALIAACGPYELAPAKTRVAFLAEVRFASVNRVAPDAIDIHFVLPRAVDHAGIRRREQLGKLYVHHVRIAEARALDRPLAGWLRASYREYGQRRWLRR
jgi:hypothetical protein